MIEVTRHPDTVGWFLGARLRIILDNFTESLVHRRRRDIEGTLRFGVFQFRSDFIGLNAKQGTI